MSDMAMISIRIPDDLHDQLKAEAQRLDRSASWIARKALEAALVTKAGSGEDARVSPSRLPASPRTPALEEEPSAASCLPAASASPRAKPARTTTGRTVGPIPKGGK